MATNCTRCDGTGFLNLHQIPETELTEIEVDLVNRVQEWIKQQLEPHDVQVCDCCGDGEGWYGNPGEHYTNDDPPGPKVPYANNGGLCQCH